MRSQIMPKTAVNNDKMYRFHTQSRPPAFLKEIKEKKQSYTKLSLTMAVYGVRQTRAEEARSTNYPIYLISTIIVVNSKSPDS